jgi:hypothetical protein
MNGLVFINVPKFHWTFNVHQLGEFQCHPGTRDGDHQSKVVPEWPMFQAKMLIHCHLLERGNTSEEHTKKMCVTG